jgi:hypothetical protein
MNEGHSSPFNERVAIEALLRSLKPLSNIGHRTSFANVVAFLSVVVDEGKTGTVYARSLGVSRYTALRWFHILANQKRDRSPGVGLIVFKSAQNNRQQKQIFLSDKGRKLAHEIVSCLRAVD